MRSPNQPSRRGQGGQTLVEFALAIPILLLLTVGIFDIGRGVFYFNALADCAREGARFGIVLTDPYYEKTLYSNSNPWAIPGNAPNVAPFAGPVYIGSNYVGTTTIVGKTVDRATTLDKSKLKVYIQVNSLPVWAHFRLPLKVYVEYPYEPLLGNLFGGMTITLKGASRMITQ